MAPIALVIIIPLYLLPSIIAAFRRHELFIMILGINILLGWTLVGWVISLVMALEVYTDTTGLYASSHMHLCHLYGYG